MLRSLITVTDVLLLLVTAPIKAYREVNVKTFYTIMDDRVNRL